MLLEKIESLKNTIHFEPLTSIALERYDLFQNGNELRVELISNASIKDVDFIIELCTVYGRPDLFDSATFSQYSMSVVLDYLKRTHAFYKERMLPKMEMAIKSIQSQFPDHPVSAMLTHFYSNYQNELLEHIELEENRLFPYAESLYDGKKPENYSVVEFRYHHDHNIEDHLQTLLKMVETEFSDVAASFAYRAFKNMLVQFKVDLNIHHKVEEEVFLCMVESLERR
ncbi:MAG: hypothetical protein WEC59_06695 [Salibacteraceae bacterium]